MRFHVRRGGDRLGEVSVPLPGAHNVLNALAALAVATLGRRALPRRRPTRSRASPAWSAASSTRASAAGIRVVDDYGHHPTEIRATLAAARGLHSGRIVVVFQPHRYTRTQRPVPRLHRRLPRRRPPDRHGASTRAGEEKIPGVESGALVDGIRARGHRHVDLVADLEQVADALGAELKKGDLVITLGAGSVTRLGTAILAKLRGGRVLPRDAPGGAAVIAPRVTPREIHR